MARVTEKYDSDPIEQAKAQALAEYFITSKAEKVKTENLKEMKIEVKKTIGNKCPRCWKILAKECAR